MGMDLLPRGIFVAIPEEDVVMVSMACVNGSSVTSFGWWMMCCCCCCCGSMVGPVIIISIPNSDEIKTRLSSMTLLCGGLGRDGRVVAGDIVVVVVVVSMTFALVWSITTTSVTSSVGVDVVCIVLGVVSSTELFVVVVCLE